MMIFAVFALALLLLAGGLIARPFVIPPSTSAAAPEHVDDEALVRSDELRHLLDAIRELDADLAVGKLSEDDHRDLRASYAGRAATLMRQIEEASVAAQATAHEAAGTAPAVDPLDSIEAAVRARRDVLRGES